MSCPALLLVPTGFEARRLLGKSVGEPAAPRPHSLPGHEVFLAGCGVGLAAAGVLAARWIAECTPSHVVLVGTAGTYRPQALPVGSVLLVDQVTVHGIGSGEGEEHQALNFPTLPEGLLEGNSAILSLSVPALHSGATGSLLSVTSAAASPADVCRRLGEHPEALAEDMEGYAVALAARLAGVPLFILRGISNRAGDRNHASWRFDEALSACRAVLPELLESLEASP